MLDHHLLTLHTLTMRQLASAEQLAEINGLAVAEVEQSLATARADGSVVAARDSYMISPAGREKLDAAYPGACAQIRADQRIGAAMDDFEAGVNKQVLRLTTDWQTVEVDGERVPNDHADPDYDANILDRLARLHEKLPKVLLPIADAEPLLGRFFDRLGTALIRAEGGETAYVSGVRVDSYHTIWFQMHEHLLRLTGRERPE